MKLLQNATYATKKFLYENGKEAAGHLLEWGGAIGTIATGTMLLYNHYIDVAPDAPTAYSPWELVGFGLSIGSMVVGTFLITSEETEPTRSYAAHLERQALERQALAQEQSNSTEA